MQSADVAIVMPSFNSSRHIRTAIASVLAQSYSNWELVIADGGSRDETCRIVEEFAKKDQRIRLLKNEKDHGPAHARYLAIKASRAPYVAFLDADDWWLPRKLEEQ